MTYPSQVVNLRVSTSLKISAGVVLAAMVAFGPGSAYAQHGGGGGSHGGGGGGGTHGSSGGGRGSGGSHGKASGGPGGSGGGGAARGPAVGSAAAGGGASGSGMESRGSHHFVGGNNSWQEPPSSRGGVGSIFAGPANGTVAAAKSSGMIASRTFVVPMGLSPMRPGTAWGSRVFPVPPRIFFPRHLLGGGGFGFFGGGCFSGFFPGFCGTSFWWGPMWAWGPNCDPDWGCNGCGYLNYDAGYGNGVPGNYDAAANGDARSVENGPFSLRAWPADESAK